MKLKPLSLALFGSAFFLSGAHAANNDAAAVVIDKGYRIVYGSTGQPLLKPPTVVEAGATSGEAMIRDMFKTAPGPAGKTVEVAAKRRIPWGAIARGAARAAPWVVAGMAIWEIYDQLRVKPDGQGGWQYDPGIAPREVPSYNCKDGTYAAEAGGCYARALAAHIALRANGSTNFYYTTTGAVTCRGVDPASCSGVIVEQREKSSGKIWSTNEYSQSFSRGTEKRCENGRQPGLDGKCPTDVWQPMTQEEVETLMEKNAPKDKARNVVEELLKNDHEFQPKPAVEISGTPKVELEPKVKTETDPQGNTKTTTTKDVYNITYQGDSYTWNVTTITVNSDGSKSEETKPDPTPPPPDPDMPAMPKLYKQKYPEGMAGVWKTNSQALSSTPIFRFLQGLNPNLGSGGCPAFRMGGGKVLGITVAGEISPPCEVWAFLRVFFVICALLLSRRLIFGG